MILAASMLPAKIIKNKKQHPASKRAQWRSHNDRLRNIAASNRTGGQCTMAGAGGRRSYQRFCLCPITAV